MNNKLLINLIITASGKFGVLLIQFVTTVILARLLTPEDFGIIAMCTLFFSISNVLIDSGMGGSIIYHKETDEIDYDTIFWFNLLISIFLYALLYIFSSNIALFYNVPILENILKISGLSIIIHSSCIIHSTLLSKHLKFKKITNILIISSLLNSIIVICLALLGFGIWTLVIQQVLINLIQVVLFFFQNTYIPKFRFSYTRLKKHWSFGSKLLFSSLLKLIYDNMYVQTIGKVVTLSNAGYYNQAKKINDIPMNVLSYPLERVLFPTLAHSENFNNKCMKCVHLFSLIVIPCMFLGAYLSADIIDIILGQKWEETGWMLSFMLIGTIGSLLENLNRSFIKATGETSVLLKTDSIKRGLNFIILILSINWGIKGILIAFIINSFIGWFFNCIALKKVTKERIINMIKYPLLVSAYCIIPLSSLYLIKAETAIIHLCTCLFVFGLTYSITLVIFERNFAKSLILKLKNK